MQEEKPFVDEAASVGKEPHGAGNEDGAKSRALGLRPWRSKSLPTRSVPSIGASEGIIAGVYTKQTSDPELGSIGKKRMFLCWGKTPREISLGFPTHL